MNLLARNATLLLLLLCATASAVADEYSDTVEIFKGAGESSKFFNHAYAYACLLYTSDAADERSSVDLGGRRIIKKKKLE